MIKNLGKRWERELFRKKTLFLLFFIISAYFPSMILNVKDCGAVGNGKTDDTHSFQNAVNILRENGGGVL